FTSDAPDPGHLLGQAPGGGRGGGEVTVNSRTVTGAGNERCWVIWTAATLAVSLLGSEQDLQDSLEGSISRWQDGLLYGNKVTAWRAEEAELLRQVRSQAGAWERGQNDRFVLVLRASCPKGIFPWVCDYPKGQLLLWPAIAQGRLSLWLAI